jgi:hypothetical protein
MKTALVIIAAVALAAYFVATAKPGTSLKDEAFAGRNQAIEDARALWK